MKLVSMLLMIFACASFCGAQEVTQQGDSPAGLVILKMKRERRREQPFDVRHTATDPDALNNTGMMPSGGGSQFPTFVYEYSVEIRNDSPKRIRWLGWVYVLTDPDNKQEVDRQEVISLEKIAPGKNKTIYGRKRISPMQPRIADVKKKNGSPFQERVEFICVAYDDGTFWHRAYMSDSQCTEMEKRGKSRSK